MPHGTFGVLESLYLVQIYEYEIIFREYEIFEYEFEKYFEHYQIGKKHSSYICLSNWQCLWIPENPKN